MPVTSLRFIQLLKGFSFANKYFDEEPFSVANIARSRTINMNTYFKFKTCASFKSVFIAVCKLKW